MGFNQTNRASVHLTRRPFIYAAPRGARLPKMQIPKNLSVQPVEQVFMRLRGPNARMHGLKRQIRHPARIYEPRTKPNAATRFTHAAKTAALPLRAGLRKAVPWHRGPAGRCPDWRCNGCKTVAPPAAPTEGHRLRARSPRFVRQFHRYLRAQWTHCAPCTVDTHAVGASARWAFSNLQPLSSWPRLLKVQKRYRISGSTRFVEVDSVSAYRMGGDQPVSQMQNCVSVIRAAWLSGTRKPPVCDHIARFYQAQLAHGLIPRGFFQNLHS